MAPYHVGEGHQHAAMAMAHAVDMVLADLEGADEAAAGRGFLIERPDLRPNPRDQFIGWNPGGMRVVSDSKRSSDIGAI